MQIQSLLSLLSATAKLQDGANPGNSLSAENCHGESPRLLNTATIPYKNSEVVLTTYSLPATTKDDALSTAPQDMCDLECKLKCQEFPRPDPSTGDCNALAEFIQDKSGSFVAAAHTNTTLTYKSCASKFLNRASGDYQYCYSNWGSIAAELVNNCMPDVNGAACVNSYYHWGFEISGPGM